MADISTELARILSAIYGEDVRGSIHDAIEKINNVSEVVLTTGTAVTSPSSSSTGFYDDSLYLNTDTFELWKCTGVNTWASQGILKGEAGDDGNGIVSITKTATSGLVDTYTITYTNGTTSTFTVTNGENGANGNKWYRGTGISGKAALPTVYTTSGVADANSGDMFLNPSEGAVYSCVTGGIPTVATWQYETTLSGGGGTSDYADLTNKPQINGHELSGNQTGADLGLASSSDIPTVDQTYDATSSNAQSGKAVAEVVEQIYADNGVLGAKNLLRYPYVHTSKTENGITFTDNGDGSITISGTASADAIFQIATRIASKWLEEYIGMPVIVSGGLSENVAIKMYVNSISDPFYNTGGDTAFTVPSQISNNSWNIYVRVKNGADLSTPVTVKPMIRLASDSDNTYVPYAMTNRELTEAIATIPTVNDGQLTIQQNGTNKATFTANQSGNATVNIVTDDWVATGTVSGGAVSFSGIDDSGNYGYKPFAEVTASSTNKNPTAQISTLSGTGTSSMSVTYTTDADNGTTVKLRRIK